MESIARKPQNVNPPVCPRCQNTGRVAGDYCDCAAGRIQVRADFASETYDELVRDYHSQTYAGQVADECWFTGAR